MTRSNKCPIPPASEDVNASPTSSQDTGIDRHPLAIAIITAVITACLTGIIGFLTLGWTSSSQRDLEREKFDRQFASEQRRDTFTASIELANHIAAALYEIGSFLESSRFHPEQINGLFSAHETRMKSVMPPVVAAHVAVAAHDYSLFERFAPLIKEISDFDACLTRIYNETQGTARDVAIAALSKSQSIALSRLAPRVYDVAINRREAGDLYPAECQLPALPPRRQ